MPQFPQQVKTEKLGEALSQFFQEVNQEIKGRLQEYQRESNAGASGENFSEIDYNNRQLQKVFQQLQNGEEKVDVEWYKPVVERTSPPKVSMQKKSFQLEHRYGNWIKHDHDLA